MRTNKKTFSHRSRHTNTPERAASQRIRTTWPQSSSFLVTSTLHWLHASSSLLVVVVDVTVVMRLVLCVVVVMMLADCGL